MKQLSVGKKFVISFGMIMVLFLCTTIAAIVALSKTENTYREFYETDHQAVIHGYQTRLQMQLGVKNVILSTLSLDPETTSTYIKNSDSYMENVKTLVQWFDDSYTGDKSLIQEYNNMMTKSAEVRQQILDLSNENTAKARTEAQKILMNEYNPSVDEAGTYIDQFVTNISNASKESYTKSIQLQNMIRTMIIVVAVVAFLVTVLFAGLLTKGIVFPVLEIGKAMQQIQNGNLDVAIHYESKDELGMLAQSMRELSGTLTQIVDDEEYVLGEMASGNFNVRTNNEEMYVGDYTSLLHSMKNINEKLSDTLKTIDQSSSQVSMGAEQVSISSQDLAQGATEQASSVEELAASINEISRQIEENAQGATAANQEAEHVQREAEESNSRMQDMLLAMDNISDSSNEIGKIIQTIEDIAFQTNILALNAAVEAARAGSAGKGFAVVADEVRNLAGKSAEASKNTARLIERSLEAVKNGKHIADETAQSLLRVVDGVKNVATSVDTISNASTQQAEAIAQLTIGVDQISSVIQNNSAVSEEAAAASEELSSQAQMLKQLVAQFQLRK